MIFVRACMRALVCPLITMLRKARARLQVSQMNDLRMSPEVSVSPTRFT